jgi:hypothetical protein
MDLYLSGANLQEIYDSLPEAPKQKLPKTRKKATEEILNEFYKPGISPTTFRRNLNNAGYSISVENAFKYIKGREI